MKVALLAEIVCEIKKLAVRLSSVVVDGILAVNAVTVADEPPGTALDDKQLPIAVADSEASSVTVVYQRSSDCAGLLASDQGADEAEAVWPHPGREFPCHQFSGCRGHVCQDDQFIRPGPRFDPTAPASE